MRGSTPLAVMPERLWPWTSPCFSFTCDRMAARSSARKQLFTATFSPQSAHIRTSNSVRGAPANELEVASSPGVYGPGENGGSINSPVWWVVDIYIRGSVIDATTTPPASIILDDTASTSLPFHYIIKSGIRSAASFTEQHWVIDAACTRLFVFGSSVGVLAVAADFAVQSATAPLPARPRLIAGQHTVGIAALLFCDGTPGRLFQDSGGSRALVSSSLRVLIPPAAPGPDWGVPIPPRRSVGHRLRRGAVDVASEPARGLRPPLHCPQHPCSDP